MGLLVNPLAMFCRVFRGWTAFRHHSALVEVLCCYWQSGHEQATQPPRRPHASHISCRDISMAEPSGLSTVWLGHLQKQLQSRSRGEAARGINLHPGKHPNNHHGNHSNPHLGNVTEWLHAPTMLLLMCGHLAWQKPLPLFAWAWLPSANCRLPFCSQNLMCYPWVSKRIDQRRWSLATVTSGHRHPSILGATAIVEYQP